MELTKCHILDICEMRTAACVAAFFRRLNQNGTDYPARTGVRADWMEQDGPCVRIVGVLDVFLEKRASKIICQSKNKMEIRYCAQSVSLSDAA